MYRIDHLAFRTNNRLETAKFFIDALGYRIQTEFDITFEDGSVTQCIAMEPTMELSEWTHILPSGIEYHRPPELFVSDGPENSIVGKWVLERNGIGGLHHIALQCENVGKSMKEWMDKGYAEFTTESPLTCPEISQCFSKPSKITGIVFELIQRGKHGFCKENVKNLMLSTKSL